MTNSAENLTEIFSHFPGIGPRQARRFVYHLLHQSDESLSRFTGLISKLHKEITPCNSCHRFAPTSPAHLCSICASPNRDKTQLMVVVKDIDLENIEKTHSYNGSYFVLGGTVPLTESDANKLPRAQELLRNVSKRSSELKEIIIAMAANVEGDHTTEVLRNLLTPIIEKHGISISTLGRGLSTGTELEYSDADTINNALRNRRGV